MRTKLIPWLLLIATVAVEAQTFDTVVSGEDITGQCHITPIVQRTVQWYNPNLTEHEDVTTIASSDGRRVLALLFESPLRIVEIRPDGSRLPFYSGLLVANGNSMTIASNGTVFVATGSPVRLLARISPAGTLEATYPLIAEKIAVGADGCTIYYRYGTNNVIRRINGCTGAALPDFATPTWITDLEVLPDGQVLVSSGSQVALYDASGTLVRVVANLASHGLTDHVADAIAVRGGVLYIAAVKCDDADRFVSVLLQVGLSDGSEIARAPLEMTSANAIVIGAAAAAIPTLGEVALALLVFALAAGGALVLKLR